MGNARASAASGVRHGSAGSASREQTRARDPDATGFVDRSGVRVY